MPVNQGSCESVKSTIKSNESDTHRTQATPKINSVPAVRGPHGNHFDGMGPKGGKQ